METVMLKGCLGLSGIIPGTESKRRREAKIRPGKVLRKEICLVIGRGGREGAGAQRKQGKK